MVSDLIRHIANDNSCLLAAGTTEAASGQLLGEIYNGAETERGVTRWSRFLDDGIYDRLQAAAPQSQQEMERKSVQPRRDILHASHALDCATNVTSAT
jgi:hypothetical protein